MARHDDAGEIVALIRGGFAPDRVAMFIYGCGGIQRFIEDQIDAAELGVDTQFLVLEQEERLVACIEMRVLFDRLFLSYVAVDPSVRKQRCGSRLLAAAIDRLGRPEHRELSLDVFEDNSAARAWYDGLGMHDVSVTNWYDLPLPHDRTASSMTILGGLAQARLSHREYGFGQFSVTSSTGSTHPIGLLGEHVFRISAREPLEDRHTLACLTRLDPRRRILALLPANEQLGNTAPFARTRRKTSSLADVRERLAELS